MAARLVQAGPVADVAQRGSMDLAAVFLGPESGPIVCRSLAELDWLGIGALQSVVERELVVL